MCLCAYPQAVVTGQIIRSQYSFFIGQYSLLLPLPNSLFFIFIQPCFYIYLLINYLCNPKKNL
jgi:hypothetical protein